MNKYKLAAAGGTFDLLHHGHKEFIKAILASSKRLVIGLTTDLYISKNKKGKNIASFEVRKKALEDFLKEIGEEGRVEIIPIDDMFGPLLNPDFKPDALAVSGSSIEAGESINQERIKRGLPELELIKIPTIKTEEGKIISSTMLRENLLLPSTLRYLLQDPWGKILDQVPDVLDGNKIITVGDVTTQKFTDLKIQPKLSIIDFRVERKEIPKKEFGDLRIIHVKNQAGSITSELSEAIQDALGTEDKAVIIVDGEEDLGVLPALLYAPLGFSVFYGQPNQGLVRLEVNEEIKVKARQLIDRFEIV